MSTAKSSTSVSYANDSRRATEVSDGCQIGVRWVSDTHPSDTVVRFRPADAQGSPRRIRVERQNLSFPTDDQRQGDGARGARQPFAMTAPLDRRPPLGRILHPSTPCVADPGAPISSNSPAEG